MFLEVLRKDRKGMLDEELKDEEEAKEEERRNKTSGGFVKGVLTGILGTVLAAVAVIAISVAVTGGRIAIIQEGGASKGIRAALSDDVIGKINELIGYIHLYFYDEVEEEQLAEGIYSGLLAGVDDKYTEYYTAQEYADLQISATQNYYGIGAALLQDANSMQVTISRVYDVSPAKEAGLKENDVIVMVEEIESTSMELSELVTHIRGDRKSVV